MRYAYYKSTGPASEVLKLAVGEKPSPTDGQVLVQVFASGVNPSDVKTRAASAQSLNGFVVPHSDGSRVITAVGQGVPTARIGQRVWLRNAQWHRQWGTAAEYIALPATQAVPLPDSVSFEVGATLGVPFLTAWHAVHHHVKRDSETTMLVQGGAVGHYAIQLAKRAGYQVIASVSSKEKVRIATNAGADLAVDYKQDDLAGAIRDMTHGTGVDRIVEVDLTTNATTYTKLLRPNGFVAAYGSRGWQDSKLPLRDWLFHGVDLSIFIVYELPAEVRASAIAGAQLAFTAQGFQSLIAARFSLDDIASAHELVESGTAIGNVLVLPGGKTSDELV